MSPRLELSHQIQRNDVLVFSDRSAYSQAGVDIYRRPAPEGAAFIFFEVPPFLPLWPT